MCVCVYVCVYVCIYIYMYTHTYLFFLCIEDCFRHKPCQDQESLWRPALMQYNMISAILVRFRGKVRIEVKLRLGLG